MGVQTFKSYINSNRETIYWQNWVSNHNKEILHLERAGITDPDPNYTIFRTQEKADFYVIEYVTAGKGHIESMGKIEEVSEGDVYIIHQRTQHLYFSDKDDPFRKKWLNVSGTFISSMLSAFKIEGPFFVMKLGEKAERILDDIHRRSAQTSSADIDEMVTYTMKRLLDLFIMIDDQRRSEADAMPLEDRIVRYIENNICLDISVAKLTETFFISSSTLYRMFQRLYGMSPKDFILKKKIEFAVRMISLGDANMQMVASTLNFYDSHHFFRTFKKYVGVTPGEYKKQLEQGENSDD